MELQKFKEDLMQLLPSEYSRPFICRDSPLNCKVFIIGINPATESDNFWNYWSDEKGFDYNNWFENYKKSRKLNGKREVSPTRRNLAIITDILAEKNISVLETNLYTKPTTRAKELHASDKKTDVLDFLIQRIKPIFLLVHGNKTVREMQKKIGKDLTIPTEVEANIGGVTVGIWAIRHLSYQFSNEGIKEVGQKLIEKVKHL